MELKTIIYTTSKNLWIKRDFEAIYDTLKKASGVTVHDFDVVYFDMNHDLVSVKESDGGTRIDWDWMSWHCPAKGHNAVCLHISTEDREKLGLRHPDPKQKLGGSYNRNTGDDTLDFVVIADRGGRSYDDMSSFERIFIHELSHGFSHWRGVVDYTHLWDYTFKNIKDLYLTHDFSFWNSLKAKIEYLKSTLAAGKLHAPLDPQFMKNVTQKFGVPNPRYPTTKHHVGIDIAVPSGEACYALADGEVVHVVRDHPILGNATYFEFFWKGQRYTVRYLHQSRPGTLGSKKRGEYLGSTGNTGDSTGPHLHLDMCKSFFNLNGINETNFRIKFIDPLLFF